MRNLGRLLALVSALLALLLGLSSRSWAYVEVPHSLGQVVGMSTNILLMRVEKVDKEKNIIIYSKIRDVKGKHPQEVIKHNIGKAGFHPREWQYCMEWAEPGKVAVFCHNGGASETCLGNYWYQAYAGGEWWTMSHGEPYLLRSFAGNPEKLANLVTEMLAGREVIAPCMVDGNKDDLQQKRAKIQRLKASLKIQDYNPKRDFVGWGGDDFRRLQGLPGFTHIAGLSRVDPDAQAISCVDFDGDGKLDLCLLGGGRLALLQYGGESINEITVPGVTGGARAGVWADFNRDGKPDLLLATTQGPRLFANLSTGFVDVSHLLPKEPGYNVTAVAWLDHDNDGRPDILLGNGYHGLRLYRNALETDKLLSGLNHADAPVRERTLQQIQQLGPVAEPELKPLAEKVQSDAKEKLVALLQAWAPKPANAPAPPAPPAPPAKPATPATPVPMVESFPWFRDVSDEVGLGRSGLGSAGKGETLTVFDCDNDGRPDFLYGLGQGLLARNTGKGFVAVPESGLALPSRSVGPIVGDMDQDGLPDLLVPSPLGCKLYRNLGQAKFEDVTSKAGALSGLTEVASAAWGDVDGDGLLDLVLGRLRKANVCLRNLGAGSFADYSDKLGLEQRIFNSQAVCLADLNNDGALDMIFNNEGQESTVLLGNPELLAKRTPVLFKVAGAEGVVGSQVLVRDEAGKLCAVQQIAGSEARGGQSAPVARFALAPGKYRLEVRYSSGTVRGKELLVAQTTVRGVLDEQTPILK